MCVCVLDVVNAGMKLTCNFAIENSPEGAATLQNITINTKGYNGTVIPTLAPGSTFSWQQVYPFTAADVYETYVDISITARGYIALNGRAVPYDVPALSSKESLPGQLRLDFRVTPSLQGTSEY
jgi:ABC-type transport system substrate-binding protein